MLCANGHSFEYDCYSIGELEDTRCPDCDAKVVWWNSVDVTNGSFDYDDPTRRIDGYIELEVDISAKTCKCTTCNNVHVVESTTYKIPNGGSLIDIAETLEEGSEIK